MGIFPKDKENVNDRPALLMHCSPEVKDLNTVFTFQIFVLLNTEVISRIPCENQDIITLGAEQTVYNLILA